MHIQVTLTDIITLSIGVIGLVAGWLSRKNRLPKWAQTWLARIKTENVLDAIKKAEAIAELTPDQKRKQAVVYLQELSIKELGFPIPASIANLLVEFVYQQWKRARR